MVSSMSLSLSLSSLVGWAIFVVVLISTTIPVYSAESSSHNQQVVGIDENNNDNNQYVIVGVSGGLQGGFPERFRMDYNSGLQDEIEAKFLGRALVRGYRSYLDVMQKDWRQYTPEPDPRVLINCNVIATGCWHHANEYWMYAVDARQFVTILFNEPRFLSITPDLGLIDLTAEETSPLVKFIAKREIKKQNKTDSSHVAFPIVTGAWYNPESHVPSPVLYTKEDGTQVTNFAESLAVWIGIDIDNTANGKATATSSSATSDASTCDTGENNKNDSGNPMESESFQFLEPGKNSEIYFDSVRKAVRYAEKHRSPEAARADGPGMVDCPKKARFGVSKDMARVNYPFPSAEIESILSEYVSSSE